MNVRGLQDANKRKQVFMYVKKLGNTITFLQETHSIEADEKIWKSEFGGTIVFSHHERNSRGVTILINPKSQVCVKKVSSSNEGRYVAIDCTIEGKDLLLVNVYAPNIDQPEFFQQLFDVMALHQNADRIIAGDFNLVLNEKLDLLNRKNNNVKAQKILEAYIDQTMLVDVWRHAHPQQFQFTWYKKCPTEMYARLDYIFVNYALMSGVKQVEHIPGYKSDHSFVRMYMEIGIDNKRGPGFWKLNESILTEQSCLKKLNRVAERINQSSSEGWSACVKWEQMKSALIKECQNISKEWASKVDRDIRKITEALKLLQERQAEHSSEPQQRAVIDQIEQAQNQLSKIMQYKARGARIRSRSMWYQEGEKGTKYFLRLEKVKYNNKTVNALLCEDGTITRNEKKILREQTKFYRKLYSANPDIKFKLVNETEVKFNAQQKEEIDKPFEFEDFKKALKAMARGKAPGNDGLTTDFYIVMFTKIGETVWNAVQESHHNGCLYRSARRGIISLIPKEGKDPLLIGNWRPLTLLNTDHKIITKMLTNRLKEYLSQVIGVQQTGYVPGRYIGINLRKMIDILLYMQQTEQSGLLLTIDFEKCFDSIEHNALVEALRYFNVGEYFISWVTMLYNDFECCVINNGRWSQYYKQERGVHQGSALSGPLFLFVAEILAISIKNNSEVKGVIVEGLEEKISQYADDTNIWSESSEQLVNAVIKQFDQFYANTGLKVNYEKSVIYKIGSQPESNDRFQLIRKFRWGTNRINTLGLTVMLDCLEDLEECNFHEIMEKAQNILTMWKSRGLSIIGKVEMINSLVNSLFVYKMQVLPTISEGVERKVVKMLTDFVWSGRKPKLKNSVLTAVKTDGGLNLANLQMRDMSLKIEWIRRMYHSNDEVLTKLAYYFINAEIKNGTFWQCNFSSQDAKKMPIKSKFWRSVVVAWAEFNFHTPITEQEMSTQILWYNSYIKSAGSLLFIKSMYDVGILYVKDLVMNDRFATYEELVELYGMPLNVMDYNKVVAAVPHMWKRAAVVEQDCEDVSKFNDLMESEKWSNHVYKTINHSLTTLEVIHAKWLRLGYTDTPFEEIEMAFHSINKSTSIVKYRSFQFRLLHQIVPFNNKLFHIGLVPNNLCTMCCKEKETMKHFFVQCEIAKDKWCNLFEYIQVQYDVMVEFNEKKLLLNSIDDNPFSFVNLATNIMKQKLYACRCLKKTLNISQVINELEFIHDLERNNALSTKNVARYNKTWPDVIEIEKYEDEYDNILDTVRSHTPVT